MKETEYQKQIQDYGHEQDWRIQRNLDSRKSVGAGFPDLYCARRGDTLFWEVKMEKGKVSDAQKEWFYQVTGGKRISEIWLELLRIRLDIIYPDDWDYVTRTLDDPHSTHHEWLMNRAPQLDYMLAQWAEERPKNTLTYQIGRKQRKKNG